MKLHYDIIPVQNITEETVNQMLHIMKKYYTNITSDKFVKDLSEKDDIILLKQEENIRGFSTQKWYNIAQKRILFSGDTIIQKEFWGEQALTKGWVEYSFKNLTPESYWFLISKGYKTYRFLPTFFKEYYPAYNHQSQDLREIVQECVSALFPKVRYNNDVLFFQGVKDSLKEDIAPINPELRRNKHIAYFEQKNPTWYLGNELACITKISYENLTRMGSRIVKLNNKHKQKYY